MVYKPDYKLEKANKSSLGCTNYWSQPVLQSRIQKVRDNWPNIYTVLKTLARSNKYDIDANNLDD